MTCRNWEAIHGFNTPEEYQRFLVWLELQIARGLVKSIPIRNSKEGVPAGFDEKWFKCEESREVWCLVAPEPPFRGLWAKIA